MHGSSHSDRGSSPCGRMNLMPLRTPGSNRSVWLVVCHEHASFENKLLIASLCENPRRALRPMTRLPVVR